MTFGISMVKDEADVIEQTITHMLSQVDRVIVADNGSSDGTREILEAFDVDIVDDPEPGYYQSRKMSALAARAANKGADWVVPFDADEVWYSPFGRIGDELSERPESIASAALYDHVATADDPDGPPLERMGWRRQKPVPLVKVACRTHPILTIHQGNHGADYGGGINGRLVIRHFPYRSVEQFIRKVRNGAAAYAATDLSDDVGSHWREYGRFADEELEGIFHKWFHSASPTTDSSLIYDPVSSFLSGAAVPTASAP